MSDVHGDASFSDESQVGLLDRRCGVYRIFSDEKEAGATRRHDVFARRAIPKWCGRRLENVCCICESEMGFCAERKRSRERSKAVAWRYFHAEPRPKTGHNSGLRCINGKTSTAPKRKTIRTKSARTMGLRNCLDPAAFFLFLLLSSYYLLGRLVNAGCRELRQAVTPGNWLVFPVVLLDDASTLHTDGCMS